MNRTVTSLLLLVLLMLLIVSPFSALAMLMMVMFAGAVIGLVSTIVQAVLKHDHPASSVSAELNATRIEPRTEGES